MVGLLSGCADPLDERLREIEAQQQQGRHRESIEALRAILDKHPSDAEANLLLGRALLVTGQPSLAPWPLSAAAAAPEHAVEAGLLLATALLATANPEGAVRAVNSVLEREPERRGALEIRSRGNLLALRYADALDDADRVLASEPDDLGAVAIRALALIGMGRDEEGARALEQLETRIGDVEPALEGRICVARMALQEKRDQRDQAEALLRVCLARHPADLLTVQTAVAFFEAIDKPKEATAALHAAVAAEPHTLGFRTLLAERLHASGDSEAAERLLRDAVADLPSPDSWGALANFYRNAGRLDAAREAMEHALALATSFSEPFRFAYADLLVELGDLPRAEELAEGFAETAYVDLIRGRILFERGEFEAAREALEHGIALWPNNSGARYLAGHTAQRLGRFESAISHFREAARSAPRATNAELDLAQLYDAVGRTSEALEFAIRYTRSHPEVRDGHLLTARLYTVLGQYDAARRALDRLRSMGLPEAILVSELAAVEAAAAGPEAALRPIEASGLDLRDPENELALRALVETLLSLERFDDALARVDATLALHPDLAWLHDVRGRVLQASERSADARASFERALELDPHHAPAHAALAAQAREDGDASRALALLDRAAGEDPEDPSHAYAAAQLSFALGDGEGAERRLRALQKRFPLHPGVCNDLAWILAERGESLDEALDLAQRATKLAGGAHSYDTLGWVLLRRGESERAAVELRRGVAADPAQPSIRYRLGLALAASGLRDEALREFRDALKAGPFPESDAARAEISWLEQAGSASTDAAASRPGRS